MEDCTEKVDMITCPSCNGEIEKGNRFCIHCGNPVSREKKDRLKTRFIFFGIVGLILAGAIGFLGIKGLESKLVGKVNGEEITRKEFTKRLERAKRFHESRYGQSLFEGEAGRENLNRLKTDLLDEMTTEKILLQEAKGAGYAAAPEEEIERQLEDIKKNNGVTDADLQKMINGTIDDLKKELSEGWVISQFIEKNVLKGDETNGNLVFAQWITQAKAKARIESYEKLDPVSTAKASCCKSGCGGSGKAQLLDPKVEKEARAKGLEYYEKKTQKKGADAKVTNFGCHIQVDIIEEGKIVVSLTYNGEEIQEI